MSQGYRKSNYHPKSVDHDAIKKHAYHDQDILIVNIHDTSLPWQEREILKSIGERLYGRPQPARR